MDYGQPTQSGTPAQDSGFFTSGAGTNSENENTFEAENNLDLTNTQVSWGAPEGRDPRGLGSKAITSSDANAGNAFAARSPEQNTPAFTYEAPHIPETPRFPEAPNPLEAYNPAMNSETPQVGPEELRFHGGDNPELGRVTPVEPVSMNTKEEQTQINSIKSFDESALKTTDKLDSRAVKIVDDAIAKLNQDGNIADFYNTARGMMETHLDNSYNRKLAA